MYADFLAFLAPEGAPPIADPNLTPELLEFAHLTSAPPWAGTMDEVLKFHWEYMKTLDAQPQLRIVRTKDDLDCDGIKVILGLQRPPEDANLHTLKKEGIKIIALAYEGKTSYGGGFAVPAIGLTVEGMGFIEVCNNHGFILDLSHSNSRTALEALRYAEHECLSLPVVASHGGAYAVHHHPRNLSDEVLRGIAHRGGVVGIATLTFILHETSNEVQPFVDHLCHVINLCGEDAVVIGGDGHYCTRPLDQWEAQYKKLSAKLDASGSFGSRFPYHPLVLNTPRRMEVIEEHLMFLPSSVREKIMGKNLVRFLRENIS